MNDIKASANVRANLTNMDLESLESLTNRARRLNMPGDAVVSVHNKSTFLSIPQIRITHTLPEDAEYRSRPEEFDEGDLGNWGERAGMPPEDQPKRVIQDGPPYVVLRDRPRDPEGWWDSKVQYWLGAYGANVTLTEDDRISYAEGLERRLLRDYWPPTGIKPPEYKPDAVDLQVAEVKDTTEVKVKDIRSAPDKNGAPAGDHSPAGWWDARAQNWTTADGKTVVLTGAERMSSYEGFSRCWQRNWTPKDPDPVIPEGATLEPKAKTPGGTVQVEDGQTMAVLPDAVVAMLGHWWWADEFQFWEDQDGGKHTLRASRRMSAHEAHAKGWKRLPLDMRPYESPE